ncbi:MAG: hypothetical protein KAJ19_04515 [Gammaproteobacteria bacterium]|nr:hypothetical protein [Gammaproteobacteria bacterium]
MTENVTGSSISLPSFRDGITFDVKSLNFGGTKAMIKASEGDNMQVVDVMLTETLKREFPNVTPAEIDRLEQDDYLLLIEYITEANKRLNKLDEKEEQPEDFTNPAITTA